MDNMNYEFVFKIITPSGTGSGFYIKKPNLFVTNYHVVQGSQSVAIEDKYGERIQGEVLLVCPTRDLAFIKTKSAVVSQGAPLWDGVEAAPAQTKVSVLGFPYGMPFSVTEGIISTVNTKMASHPMLQTDAAVNPGNSGGPIINSDGHIVGVTTSKMSSADNIGFALPIHFVKEELETLLSSGLSNYSVKCFSCTHYISETTDYCDNCGAEVNTAQFFEKNESSQLAQFVEGSLKKNNFNPVLCRNGREFWQYHHGSAKVSIYVYNNTFLEASSPLVHLPKENLKDFYKYLLEFEEKPFYLGIQNDLVYFTYRIHLTDLQNPNQKENLQNALAEFSKKADEMDDLLIDKHKCTAPSHYKKVA